MKFDSFSFLELLENIVDNRGKTCPTAESGIPLIATNCVLNDHLHPVFEKIRYVDDQTYKTWFRGHPKPGDMLFVTKGTPGRVCWVPDPVSFCIAQDMVAIRANEKLVYPQYLFALLRSPAVQQAIANMHVGTLIPHFKKGDFDQLYLSIPQDYEFQKRVGDFYFELSQKIELNRQTNVTLEAIAQAIFREWFVNFNYPVLHYDLDDYMRTMRVGGENHSESGNQTNHSTDMVEGEMGLMPAGWRVGTLGEVCEVKGGTTPSTKDETYWNGEHHWATPRDLSNLSSPILLTTERKITKAGVDKISSGILPKGTLLLSSRAPIGYLAIASIPVSINQGFIAINAKKASNLFLLHWLRENMGIVISRANGSTFLEISKTNFRTIQLVVPDINTIRNFDKVVTPIFEQIENNERESTTLAQIRDALLPKLMRGEIV